MGFIIGRCKLQQQEQQQQLQQQQQQLYSQFPHQENKSSLID